jgi:hypothetical protein
MLTFDELPDLPELEYTQHVLFFYKYVVEATLGEPVELSPEKVQAAKAMPEEYRNQLRQPLEKPWYEQGMASQPVPWYERRPDTDTTLYRHNHIANDVWYQMSYDRKREWVANMTRIHGKSVVS